VFRIIRLLLLGLIAYVLSIVWLFPAAPVIDRIKPQIQPVNVAGVEGRLYRGTANSVIYNDDLLPLELSNVQWRLMPRKLLAAAAGVGFSFDAYGGSGEGEFSRFLSGDMSVESFVFNGPAKGLEPLLPLPVAEFNGDLQANLFSLEIEQQLLKRMEGRFNWKDARLEAPIAAFLGDVNIDVEPAGENNHRGIIEAKGGEVELSGSVEVAHNGDFRSDVLITPTDDATPELLNALRSFARPDRDGRFRVQRNGNVNRLL